MPLVKIDGINGDIAASPIIGRTMHFPPERELLNAEHDGGRARMQEAAE